MSLESKIDDLVAALDRNTAAQGAAPKKGKAAATPTESASPAQPATPAASAPAASVAEKPVTPTTPAAEEPDQKALLKATEKVIELANDYSRDAAIAILGKRKVTKCSQLNPDQWQAVFDEADEAVEKAKAASANASLV